jgi:hypothetical protein
MTLSRKHLLIAVLALIAVTNAVALIGVAYNRSAEPESTVLLSERELRPPSIWRGKHENSGLDLKLQWRVFYRSSGSGDQLLYAWSVPGYGGSAEWLDVAKMKSLGFDVSPPKARGDSSGYGRQLSRDVLLVLEVDGSVYRQSLEMATRTAETLSKGTPEQAKRSRETLDAETRLNSRLFVVDAGLDLATLRAKYPDRAKYAIVGGRVRPNQDMRTAEMKGGWVSGVNIDTINVPLQWRDVFLGASPDEDVNAKLKIQYEAAVAFGRRLEPWIATAKRKGP